MKRSKLISLFKSALNAANSYNAVLSHMELIGSRLTAAGNSYDIDKFQEIMVVGAGKAAAPMAQAVEKILGSRINKGLVITKYSHIALLKHIIQIEAGHPLPDRNGLRGTEKISRLLKEADKNTLVICLISGGASSLLVSPVDGVTLKDKRIATELLLKSGATINELNAVRKHLSNVKGGRLAEAAYPAKLITMMLSDVIGNRLDVIASGPTAPDNTTFADAIDVIKRYGLENRLPVNVMRVLRQGLDRKIKETPKGKEVFFKNAKNIVIGSIRHAVDAAKDKALSMGFEPEIITTELQGDARDAARYLASRALEVHNSMKQGEKTICLISGGETTVTVKGKGLGGRNQELALSFAMEIEGVKGINMLSAGTDGTDGPTDAAGAIVDGKTIVSAREFGIVPEIYLENNNSYNFFKRLDSVSKRRYHFLTGPTGTNVMDIQIILVEG